MDDELICDLIEAAALAGAYHGLAAEFPNSRSGFNKLAAKHERTVAILANRVVQRGLGSGGETPA